MATLGSYFVSKFGWQEVLVNDYNKIRKVGQGEDR